MDSMEPTRYTLSDEERTFIANLKAQADAAREKFNALTGAINGCVLLIASQQGLPNAVQLSADGSEIVVSKDRF